MHYIIIYTAITIPWSAGIRIRYPINKLEQLHLKTTGMLGTISNIQGNMVQQSEGQLGKSSISAGQIIQTKTGQEILYRELSKPFDQGPAKAFLLPGCSARKELNSSMAEYVSYLTGIIPAEDLLSIRKCLIQKHSFPGETRTR